MAETDPSTTPEAAHLPAVIIALRDAAEGLVEHGMADAAAFVRGTADAYEDAHRSAEKTAVVDELVARVMAIISEMDWRVGEDDGNYDSEGCWDAYYPPLGGREVEPVARRIVDVVRGR